MLVLDISHGYICLAYDLASTISTSPSPTATSIVPFHNNSGEQPEERKLTHTLLQPTDGCKAIFHKKCCFTKHGVKFDPTKSTGAYYWYIKIPQWGYVGHGLKCIAFYVKKYCKSSNLLQLPAGSRLVTSGARICESRQFKSMTYCVYRCNFLCIISAGILMPALLGDEKIHFRLN